MNDERKRRGEERTGEEEKRTAGVLIARWIRLTPTGSGAPLDSVVQ